MAQPSNTISVVKLPGDSTEYKIYDAQAIHNIEELGLSAALIFKGTKTTEAAILGLTSAKVGDVWLCTGNNIEYVCVTAVNGTANSNAWEKLGNVHDAASSTHTHGVTVEGTNAPSKVTGTVTVPSVSATKQYLTANAGVPSLTPQTDTVLGTGTTFKVEGGTANTTYIKATASGADVGANGTATVLTGLGSPSTDTALGTGATFKVTGGTASTSKLVTTTIKNPSVTAKSIPNVTGNTSVSASKVKNAGSVTAGTAASWSASVNNGVLSFSWGANTPTSVTLPTYDTVTATNTTLGTAIDASLVSTSNVTVATGALDANGKGASVATGVSAISVGVNSPDTVTAVTGYSKPTTTTALTGVKVTAQPTVKLETTSTSTSNTVSVATGVNAITVTSNGNDNVTALTSEIGRAHV